MAPGMWHCNGGPGPNSFGGSIQQPAPSFDGDDHFAGRIDAVGRAWRCTEQGDRDQNADDTPSLGIAMQRPLCVYLQIPTYSGTGDPTVVDSFMCTTDDEGTDFNQTPAPEYGP